MADVSSFEIVEGNFDPIPDGTYEIEVKSIVEDFSKAGHRYLKAEFEVIEGDHSNRRLWDRFNMWHPNPDAVLASQKQLSSLFTAAGFPTMRDTEDLIGEQVNARVRTQQDDGYDPKNVIKGYRSNGAPKPRPSVASKQTIAEAA